MQPGQFQRALGSPLSGLGDLAALDAACTHPDPLGVAVHQRLHCLQIHAPAPPCDVVGVRDVVAELRAFPADVAYLCHCFAPNFGLSRRRDQSPSSCHLRCAQSGSVQQSSQRDAIRHTPPAACRIFIIPGTSRWAKPRPRRAFHSAKTISAAGKSGACAGIVELRRRVRFRISFLY